MDAIGITRKIDELGRIVIPREVRKRLKIDNSSPIEIFVDSDASIVLKKFLPKCIFCGNKDNIIVYHKKHICKECENNLKKLK